MTSERSEVQNDSNGSKIGLKKYIQQTLNYMKLTKRGTLTHTALYPKQQTLYTQNYPFITED